MKSKLNKEVFKREKSFLREHGYQITGKNHIERIRVLREIIIPKFGPGRVFLTISTFMISRASNNENVKRNFNSLTEWNKDVNWMHNEYKEAVTVQLYENLIKSVNNGGYAWLGSDGQRFIIQRSHIERILV